eukprot:6209032-Pleurochrysis_carterae.AAC.1
MVFTFVSLRRKAASLCNLPNMLNPFFRLDTTYSFESPSPTNPVFPAVAAAALSSSQPAGPVTRSGMGVENALLPSQPASISAPPGSLRTPTRNAHNS